MNDHPESPPSPLYPMRPADLLVEELDGEVLVHAPRTGGSAVLNPIGGAVLELCDGSRSVPDIVSDIVDVLPENRARVTSDVTALVGELVTLGILTA
jgi:hypothetical protein